MGGGSTLGMECSCSVKPSTPWCRWGEPQTNSSAKPWPVHCCGVSRETPKSGARGKNRRRPSVGTPRHFWEKPRVSPPKSVFMMRLYDAAFCRTEDVSKTQGCTPCLVGEGAHTGDQSETLRYSPGMASTPNSSDRTSPLTERPTYRMSSSPSSNKKTPG